MGNHEKYLTIIKTICEKNNISNDELEDILKEKEFKYLVILCLKKYECIDEEGLKRILRVKTRRSLYNNIRKAEEKLLINRNFRKRYYDLEKDIKNIIDI